MIGEARTALLGVFTAAGIRAADVVPERVAPPIAVMQPSSDWVESGDTFNAFRVGFDVTLIVQTAANATVSKNLDEFVDDALAAVYSNPGFYVGSVSGPSLVQINNAEYLTASMTVYQNTKL